MPIAAMQKDTEMVYFVRFKTFFFTLSDEGHLDLRFQTGARQNLVHTVFSGGMELNKFEYRKVSALSWAFKQEEKMVGFGAQNKNRRRLAAIRAG